MWKMCRRPPNKGVHSRSKPIQVRIVPGKPHGIGQKLPMEGRRDETTRVLEKCNTTDIYPTNDMTTHKLNELLNEPLNEPLDELQGELRILQANLHKSKERTHGILNDPDTKDYTAILLQEQFWSTYTQESPSHHSWIRYEPTNKEKMPRTATYINKSQISAAQISQIPLPFTDVIAIQITPRNREEAPILIINVYNPCDESLIKSLYEMLQKMKTKDGTTIIIAGDFNCHHPLWNPPSYIRHDSVADELVELAADLSLNLLLPPGTITYPHSETTIDLVWGCNKAQERLLKCQVAAHCDQGSDHCPVETVLTMHNNKVLEKPSYDIAKTDWPKFLETLVSLLTRDIETPRTIEELEQRCTQLVEAIKTAMAKATPIKRPCPKSKRWWTPELTALSKVQKSLKNRWRRTKSIRDKKKWREKANTYSYEITKAKANH